MTERERWIVYPLLFFALGAALRDKFLQHVSTKELECHRLVAKQIECEGAMVCQGMVVLDPKNPNQRLVELGPLQPATDVPGRPSTRFGVLILRDSSGQELCGVSNNELFVRQIKCEGVAVVDPEAPQRVLAALASATPPASAGSEPQRFGVLALNNQKFWQLVGLPPAASETANPPAPATAEPPAADIEESPDSE